MTQVPARIRVVTLAAVAATAILCASSASAQPVFGNPSPTAGSATSQQANAAADQAIYKPVEYVNKSVTGPALVVIPGEVKSNHASFIQKFGPNNIADYAELELTLAQMVHGAQHAAAGETTWRRADLSRVPDAFDQPVP